MSIMKKSMPDKVFDSFNMAIMIIILILMVYPLYFIVIASFSDPYSVVNGHVYILPSGFTVEAYINVSEDSRIWLGYMNSIRYTIFGTLFSLALTIPAAYVLSKKNMLGRKFLIFYFLIPMYFSGGLVPTFLLVRSIGLMNKSYTLIFLGAMSMYNLIVARIFFQTSIPEELYESASIDGASNFRIFFQIALPLSSAIIAVMALFYAVSNWNSYFSALIYISNQRFNPLQIVLRNILINNQIMLSIEDMEPEEMLDAARRQLMAEGMKYALIFIASAPLLIAYPFVQKHFVKGVLIGSLKG